MKKTIVTLFIAGAFLASCSSNGKKAETGDAQKIESNSSETAESYTQIKEGSNIEWKASHLAGVQPRWGKVSLKSADIVVDNGAISNATITLDITSLTVENFGDDVETTAKLTGHLLSPDFFTVDSFPTSTFELTSIEKTDGDFNSKVTGNLTILDVTKSISFLANVNVTDANITIASEDFSVDRTDWGLTYNVEGTAGVPVDYLIANDIGFKIDVAIIK